MITSFKLFESPDNITIKDNEDQIYLEYSRVMAKPFEYVEISDDIWLGDWGEGHTKSPFGDIHHSGRLWFNTKYTDRLISIHPEYVNHELHKNPVDLKIISFWFLPKKEIIKKTLNKLHEKYNIDFKGWRIETKIGFIPLSEYLEDSSYDESGISYDKTLHLLDAAEKEKEMKRRGIKPKKPKGELPAEYKDKTTKYKYTESHIKKFEIFING